ncbi:MAG: NUDIX hydrolase [Coriobacteriaceae bacterium]|jgi:ADP-ribose pyrophosphatase|nr:MAG: NUDIX hydrolase [Coriobacteriaceae bacterium]
MGYTAKHEGNLDHIRELLKPDPVLIERVTAHHPQWKGRIFSVDILDVALSDGTTGEREVAYHHGGCGVALYKDSKLCLVRQYRVAIQAMTLEIPAGKLELDETSEECAARELKEETGYTADSLEFIASAAGSIGFTDEKTRVFLAHGPHPGKSHPDQGELLTCAWVPLEDVLAAVHAGLIEDSKTIIAAQAIALRL